jgi:hypothetical protein
MVMSAANIQSRQSTDSDAMWDAGVQASVIGVRDQSKIRVAKKIMVATAIHCRRLGPVLKRLPDWTERETVDL